MDGQALAESEFNWYNAGYGPQTGASTVTKTQEAPPETARDRILAAVKAAGETGCSKSELQRAAGMNRGAFRKLIASMSDAETGVLDVTHEYRTPGGRTAVHRLR